VVKTSKGGNLIQDAQTEAAARRLAEYKANWKPVDQKPSNTTRSRVTCRGCGAPALSGGGLCGYCKSPI